MKTLVRVIWIVPLLMAMCGCDRLSRYRLVSEEYGFSVEFPEKPSEQTDTNFQRLPKSLWTVKRDSRKEFYGAEATSYKEALNPRENWIPDQEALAALGIGITERQGFRLIACGSNRT